MKIFGSSLFFILSGLILGCARPDWAPAITSRNQIENQQTEKPTQCPTLFQNGLCLKWHWEKFQTENQTGTIILEFSKDELPQDPVELPAVVLWMPAMGHGAAPGRISRMSHGVFRAENIFFTMPGEWEIHFQLKSGSQVVGEIVEKFNF